MIGAVILSTYILTAEPRCVKWTWTGDVYNRKTTCLMWQDKDKKKEPEKKKK